MKNSKLILLLQTFDEDTLREFRKFVRSPFHNEQKKVTALLEYLYKLAPEFKKNLVAKERVWKKLFSDTPYNDVQMRRLMANLLRLGESFITWKKMEADPVTQQSYQLQYYREHQLDKHFVGSLRNIRKWQETHPTQDIWHYHREFVIEREIAKSISQQQNRIIDPNLQLLSDKLDAHFLINKLKCSCYIISYQNLKKTSYNLPMLQEVLDHLKKHDYSHIPMIEFYHYALLVLLEPNEDAHFEKLKKTLTNNLDLFDDEEVTEMFLALRNYCIKRSNQGEARYLEELFELYKMEVKNSLAVDNKKLSPFTYKNIVTLGIRLKKYDWTQNFIEENKKALASEFQASSYAFNLARLFFQKSEFEKIIPLLNEMEYKDIFIELSAKHLLMKTYYEMQEYEVLYSFLDSFQMFIRRKKKLLGYHCTGYMNLIKMTRQLVRLQYGKKDDIEKFKQKILKMEEMVDKRWVLGKIDSLF